MSRKFLSPVNLLHLASDPSSGSDGDIYFNTGSNVIKVYYSSAWHELTAGGGGGTGITVSTTAPSSPSSGDAWYKNDTGEFYIYDGTYWVEVNGTIQSNSFNTISVSGQSDVVADSATDTLTLIAGTNVGITTNATNDSITINSTGNYTSVDSITYPDYITFDTTPETTPTETGSIFWDSGDGLPKIVLSANVELGVGQEQVALVKNATGSSIAKGKVVYINGAQGQRPTIALSDADTEATSSKTLGLTAQTIADGAEGFVTTFGVLRGVNTNGLTEGAALWLSSTAGEYTTSIPAEPAHMVFVGYVVKAHASAGEIFINPQNGYELTELHGVAIENGGSLTDNEVLAYDSTSGLWINQTPTESNLATRDGWTHSSVINIRSYDGVTDGAINLEGYQNKIHLSDDNGVVIGVNGYTDLFTFTNSGTLTFPDASAQSTAFLGMSSYSTSNLSEGTNLYFTDERAQDAIGNNIGTGLSYNDSTGAISNSGVTSISGTTGEIEVSASTGSITIGIPNQLYIAEQIYVGGSVSKGAINFYNQAEVLGGKVNATNDTAPKLNISNDNGAIQLIAADDILIQSNDDIILNAGADTTGKSYLTSATSGNEIATQGWVDTSYLTQSNASSTYQPLDQNLTDISAFNPTQHAQPGNPGYYQGIIQVMGNGSGFELANAKIEDFLTISDASSTYQPKDQDLTDIAALSGNGFLKKTAGVWGMDTSTYLTSYTETSTLSDVTGRGATTSYAITITNATASSSTSTGALIVTGGVGVGEDLYVNNNVYIGGNIDINGTITGSLTLVDVTNLAVTDPLIYLAEGNTSDAVDIGIFAALNSGTGSYNHTGLIRDASDSGKWKLVSGVSDPTANVIDFTGATYDTLALGSIRLVGTETFTISSNGLATSTGDITIISNSADTTSGGLELKAAYSKLAHYSSAETAISAVEDQIVFSSGLWSGSIDNTGNMSGFNWQGTKIDATHGGTNQTSYATGDILYASATNTLSKLAATTDGYVLTLASGIPTWAAAASGGPSTTTTSITTNSATAIESFAKATYRTAEAIIQVTQGTDYYSSKVLLIHDGTSVKITEYAILESTVGAIPLTISSAISGSNVELRATITDAATTNATAKVILTKVAV